MEKMNVMCPKDHARVLRSVEKGFRHLEQLMEENLSLYREEQAKLVEQRREYCRTHGLIEFL